MTTSTVPPCDRLAEVIPDLVDEPDLLSLADLDHVSECLRCQAEMARFRRLHRVLSGLRSRPVEADPALVEEILDRLDSAAQRRERHKVASRRAASIVGLAAATAAGVGGVLVLATRRRSA